MDDNRVIKLAAKVVLGVVLTPIIVNLTFASVAGVSNLVSTVKYKMRIRKGLRDGSIVEIDGKYYEVWLDGSPVERA